MSRLENAIEGNAVVGVQLVPPHNVSVLLFSVQPHVKDRKALNAIVAADRMSYAELHRLTGIPKEIEESLQVCARHSGDRKSLSGTQLGIERSC